MGRRRKSTWILRSHAYTSTTQHSSNYVSTLQVTISILPSIAPHTSVLPSQTTPTRGVTSLRCSQWEPASNCPPLERRNQSTSLQTEALVSCTLHMNRPVHQRARYELGHSLTYAVDDGNYEDVGNGRPLSPPRLHEYPVGSTLPRSM